MTKCCNRFLQNPFIRLVKRVMPIFLALWHYADIGLDVNQSITYFEMAFDVNASYGKWALQYQNETNSTYLQTVSPWYFYTATMIWIGPSLIIATPYVFWFLMKNCGICIGIVISILCLPVATVWVLLFVYFLMPINLFCNSVRAVIQGDDFNEEKNYGCLMDSKMLTIVKLLEILGEALPQLTLNIIFIVHNYPYLTENDTYFGIPVPISIISAVFSLGSLLIGCKSGCNALFE